MELTTTAITNVTEYLEAGEFRMTRTDPIETITATVSKNQKYFAVTG